jgi:hypothetical protein
MNKEVIHKQVTQMAESCGFSRTHTGDVELWLCNKNDLESFAQLVAKEMREYMVFQCTPNDWMKEHIAAEREACANVCGRLADEALVVGDEDAVMCFEEAEDAIRARGES